MINEAIAAVRAIRNALGLPNFHEDISHDPDYIAIAEIVRSHPDDLTAALLMLQYSSYGDITKGESPQ